MFSGVDAEFVRALGVLIPAAIGAASAGVATIIGAVRGRSDRASHEAGAALAAFQGAIMEKLTTLDAGLTAIGGDLREIRRAIEAGAPKPPTG